MQPYLTPAHLHRGRRLPEDVKTAIVCYTPYPKEFDRYSPTLLDQRYFIHSPIGETRIIRYEDQPILLISEVYGGPVSVTTVEELAYYGVETIIGLGYVGALDDGLNLGDPVISVDAIAEPGTTPHYSYEPYPKPDTDLTARLLESLDPKPTPIRIWTTNALYREFPDQKAQVVEEGARAVNMDTSHLFAAAEKLKMRAVYLATVTDRLLDTTDPTGGELGETVDGSGVVERAHAELINRLMPKI